MRRLFGALLTLFVLGNFQPVFLKKISRQDCLPGLPENEFAFRGNGYVALDNRGIRPKKFIHIKLSFKTFADEGLVYFTGTPKGHFESLELNNGKVTFQFELSSGRVLLVSDKRYNDGKWHLLEATWMQENSSLMIDDSFKSVARSPGRFKSLNFVNAVYFGGFKGQHNIKGMTEKGFNGSIKDVQLEGTGRKLSRNTEMKNAQSGCPRRWRREADSGSVAQLNVSYAGSTNVELRWNTIRCFDAFVIQWHKLEETNETDVLNKTVTHYVVDIDLLQPNTTYMFTLKGIIDKKEESLIQRNHTTMDRAHPSLIVSSVSNSSVSVRWNRSESFVVSFSGTSQNVTVTSGTNYTFVGLMPGQSYSLKLFDSRSGRNTQREVVTMPNPVFLVEVSPSDNEINLSWKDASDVEVLHRSRDSVCRRDRLSGTSGTIAQLGSGCLYHLDVFAVSSGRRSGSHQTISVETSAFPIEHFNCNSGELEGNIQCSWSDSIRSEKSCLVYMLNFSSSRDYETRETLRYTRGNYQGLIPGERYSISILSKTSSGNISSSQTAEATAKPGIDKQFLEDQSSSTNDTISVYYSKDSRRIIDYYNVSSSGSSYILTESNVTASFGNLEAGNCYSFTAFAVSQDEHSTLLSEKICTVPNPPLLGECLNVTNNSLVLEIRKPYAGHVDNYGIYYEGINLEMKHREVYPDAETGFYSISSLTPYTEYGIGVKSVIKSPVKMSSPVSVKCRTAEGVPDAIKNFWNSSTQADKLTLNWHHPHPPNGVITGYVIRVGQPGKPPEMFEVEGSQTSYEVTYPTVLAGETYNITISAKTSVGEGTMIWKEFTLKDQPPANMLFVLLAILLAILFTILIGLLLYYYIRNSPRRMQSFRQMSNRLRNPNDMAMSFPQPSVTSKPIKISQFLELVKFLEKDSGLKFTEEYEDLKFVGRNQNREEAELQCNRIKNRFTNILPYDISRVKLLPMEDEDGSDYINANWIPGFHSKREFIASQGPLPSTVDDFWRMIWENNCQAIVMLTLCIEKGHIKCEQYWPFDKEPVFYGDLKVEIQNETKTDDWCILEFRISLGAQSRKVKHFHYAGWPDMYVPEKTSLIAFVRLVRDSVNESGSKGPVAVHCSAGVGRTGTFIALDTLLLHVQEGHDLDVYGIVFEMRMNRVLMVQTEAQYVFVYECLHQVLEESNGPVEKTIKEAAPEGDMKNEDSKEEPSDSKEEVSKKESDPKPNCNSNEDNCNDDTVAESGAENQRENATKEEVTNK